MNEFIIYLFLFSCVLPSDDYSCFRNDPYLWYVASSRDVVMILDFPPKLQGTFHWKW